MEDKEPENKYHCCNCCPCKCENEKQTLEDLDAIERNKIMMDNRRWKNRRYMAWLALISIMVVTGVVMWKIPDARIKALENILIWFYIMMSSIIGAYVGFSTLAEIKKKDGK